MFAIRMLAAMPVTLASHSHPRSVSCMTSAHGITHHKMLVTSHDEGGCRVTLCDLPDDRLLVRLLSRSLASFFEKYLVNRVCNIKYTYFMMVHANF
jgi:hypothetical protein